MSANAANRVKDAVERVVTQLEQAADGTAERLNKLTTEALDKFYRVEKSVADPLEAALKGLDELLGGNGGPPLEE
jgi:DNA-binding ferritin-like protein